MSKIMRIKRMFLIWIINTFLCGTHFFTIKRKLLIWSGIDCGKETKLVGPIYVGNIANVHFGDHVWIGTKLSIYGNGSVWIGNDIDIAPDVAFITGSHEISKDIHRGGVHRAGKGICYSIEVQDGCWIGTRVSLMGNITVGSGCVLAAACLVNKSLEPNAVYGGIPAKVLRKLED